MSNKEVNAQKQHIKDFLLNKLNWTEKRIVVLYYYDELTMAETAKVLELPESEVEKMRSSIIARCKSFVHGKE